jgi:membrane fusion protein, multidrug efflux system
VRSGRDPQRRGLLAWAVLAGVLAVACRRSPPPAAADQTVVLGPENVAIVEGRRVESGPPVSGTLRAVRAATIRAEVGGPVLAVEAQAGQPVRSGQLLARIDPTGLSQQRQAARSAVASARNAAQVAEQEAARAKQLFEAGAGARRDLDNAEVQLQARRAALADAEARRTLAEQQLGRTEIRAPFSGVVSDRPVNTGDIVAPGSPLFMVIDPARLELDGGVPAVDLGQVKLGDPVDFTVTGFGERRFQGRVTRVNPAVDPATGQVRVYVEVPNPEGTLVSGLYAQGRIASSGAVLPAAPLEAVDRNTSPPTVLRVEEGKVHRVPVEIALRDDVAGAAGFKAGVKPGDVLVLGSARSTVAEGTPVRVEGPGGAGGAPEGQPEKQARDGTGAPGAPRARGEGG